MEKLISTPPPKWRFEETPMQMTCLNTHARYRHSASMTMIMMTHINYTHKHLSSIRLTTHPNRLSKLTAKRKTTWRCIEHSEMGFSSLRRPHRHLLTWNVWQISRCSRDAHVLASKRPNMSRTSECKWQSRKLLVLISSSPFTLGHPHTRQIWLDGGWEPAERRTDRINNKWTVLWYKQMWRAHRPR